MIRIHHRCLKAVKVAPCPLFEKIEMAVVGDQFVSEPKEDLRQPGLDLQAHKPIPRDRRNHRPQCGRARDPP
ncbi:MAG: hypothetical protein FJ109_21370 [Deltaproteobacteria bacterium]|nr:hypothetical protein [Deltaproteobacteria bacterium]